MAIYLDLTTYKVVTCDRIRIKLKYVTAQVKCFVIYAHKINRCLHLVLYHSKLSMLLLVINYLDKAQSLIHEQLNIKFERHRVAKFAKQPKMLIIGQ